MRNKGALLALAGCVWWGAEAAACAPAPRYGEHVTIAEEAAVIVWDPSTKTEHFIRRATFSGEARDFGFLVPTPSVPELQRVDNDVFDRMHALTSRATVYATERAIDWTPLLAMPFLLGSKSETTTAARPAVDVVSTQLVGGYEAAILDATDANALQQWLTDNGYATTPELTEWLNAYVAKRWIISAFKIDKNADSVTARTSAVRMSFKTEEPFFPYYEPESQRTASSRMLRVWFIGPERVTGRVGDGAWPGELYWSGPARDLEAGGVKLAPNARLTAFTDPSSPRPAVADLYFGRDSDQREVIPPPYVATQIATTHVPVDLVLAPLLIGALLWRRRRRN
jgi:hypothetical protein